MKLKLILSIIGMGFFTSFLFAHSPDLSSFIIYEQSGKNFIVIKSSLTAFEQEVMYHYGKNSYKTPQEFSELAIKHFHKSCFILINNDTIMVNNPQIQLGHETTFFAELENLPQKITTYYVKNIFFRDMPNNQCELILNHKDLPQKQVILNNENKHEVKLCVEKNKWEMEEKSNSMFGISKFLSILFLIFIVIAFIMRKKKTS
ncbi:MAG: hypothetical protein QM536_06725 [Chitinophagaceae bacterium]|nr:hypothetical protein [Chitinophagaceae bacterium]